MKFWSKPVDAKNDSSALTRNTAIVTLSSLALAIIDVNGFTSEKVSFSVFFSKFECYLMQKYVIAAIHISTPHCA